MPRLLTRTTRGCRQVTVLRARFAVTCWGLNRNQMLRPVYAGFLPGVSHFVNWDVCCATHVTGESAWDPHLGSRRGPTGSSLSGPRLWLQPPLWSLLRLNSKPQQQPRASSEKTKTGFPTHESWGYPARRSPHSEAAVEGETSARRPEAPLLSGPGAGLGFHR